MLSRRLILYCGAIAMISFPLANLSAQGSPQKQSQPSGQTSNASKSASLPEQRAEWFHQQRAFPRTSIPTGVRERAVIHARQMSAGQRAVSAPGASVSGALAVTIPPVDADRPPADRHEYLCRKLRIGPRHRARCRSQ